MSVNVNQLKEQFADLKYEQLLSDKYFVETCFSKKFDSYTSKERLKDLNFKIDSNRSYCEGITNIDCIPVCNTTSTTTTTTTL
jgi:hypothetical protein